MKRTSRPRIQGFSIAEVLAATAILLIGVLAVARIFPAGKDAIESARNRSAAIHLAEKLLREFESNPLMIPVGIRPAANPVNSATAWNDDRFIMALNEVPLDSPCIDPRRRPEDSQEIYQDAPCGPIPTTNTVEIYDRLLGETYEVNYAGNYPGFVMLRFPPFQPIPSGGTVPPGDPDDASPRAYVDVTLSPPSGSEPPFTPGIPRPGTFRYVPSGLAGFGIPNPGHVAIGAPVLPDGRGGLVAVNRSGVNYRVFRCSYRWRIGAVGAIGPDHIINERHFAQAPPAGQQPWMIQLEQPFNNMGAGPIGDNQFGRLTSLTVIEEVDQTFRIDDPLGIAGGVPITNANTGLVNFYAGPLPPIGGLLPEPALPVGTRVKFDYGIARDPNDSKRLRWMTESTEVPSSGVIKLSINPVGIPDPGVPIETLYVSDAGTGALLVRGPNPTDDYMADYERGEIAININNRPVKTPLRITYRPAADWIVQVQRASDTYVPYYSAVPDTQPSAGFNYGITMANRADLSGGYQSYRSYRAYVPGVDPLGGNPYREIGFHRSEIGKTVAVDYIDVFGSTHVGEVHTIREPLAGLTFDTLPRPHLAQIELAVPYASNGEMDPNWGLLPIAPPGQPGMILRVSGMSLKVRVLWGERNNYREVVATGSVGGRRSR